MRAGRTPGGGAATMFVPFVRIDEMAWWGRVAAAALGTVQAIAADIFTGVIVAAVVLEALDWFWGRLAAQRRGDFDRARAALGLRTKILDVLLIVVVRLVELWLHRQGGVATGGWVATAIAGGLVCDNMDSIESHRAELGLRPMWGIGILVRWARAASERLLPPELRDRAPVPPPPPAPEVPHA